MTNKVSNGVKKRILIVEDEQMLVEMMAIALSEEGFDCVGILDPRKGLEILQKEHFDLVLLDLMMPQMDGFEFLAEMRKLGIEVPVIVLSNLDEGKDMKRAKELGAIDYFVKTSAPIEKIIEKVDEIVGG